MVFNVGLFSAPKLKIANKSYFAQNVLGWTSPEE